MNKKYGLQPCIYCTPYHDKPRLQTRFHSGCPICRNRHEQNQICEAADRVLTQERKKRYHTYSWALRVLSWLMVAAPSALAAYYGDFRIGLMVGGYLTILIVVVVTMCVTQDESK